MKHSDMDLTVPMAVVIIELAIIIIVLLKIADLLVGNR